MGAINPEVGDFCVKLTLTFGHFLWQATAIVFVAWLLGITFKKKLTAQLRYTLAVFTLLIMAVCPFATFLTIEAPPAESLQAHNTVGKLGLTEPTEIASQNETPRPEITPTAKTVSPDGSAASAGQVGDKSVIQADETGEKNPISVGEFYKEKDIAIAIAKFSPPLTLIYFVGVMLMLLRLTIGLHGGLRLKKISQAIEDENLLAATQRKVTSLGLKAIPHIAYCYRVVVPTVVGIFRPMVLLPVTFTTGLTMSQIEGIITHELAHIRRYDHLVNLMQRIIESVLFFHPAVWYVSRKIRIEREKCCDDLVVSSGGERLDYAESLLRVAELGLAARANRLASVAALAAVDSRRPSQIRDRVLRLIGVDSNEKLRLRRTWPSAAIIVSAVIIFSTLLVNAGMQKVITDSDEPNITVETIKALEKNIELAKEKPLPPSDSQKYRPQKEFTVLDQIRPTGNCSIKGTVISQEDSKPIGNARIALFDSDVLTGIHINVASDGTFVYKDIPAGKYSLKTYASKEFQEVFYNPLNKRSDHPFFTLKENEKLHGIVLMMKKGYSILGKILGEDGKPVAGNKFSVAALVKNNASRNIWDNYKIASYAQVWNGSYNITGMDGKPVYLIVNNFNSYKEEEPYQSQYYPGTFSIHEATQIHFDEKYSVENVDIQLKKHGGLTLEGTVVDDQTGEPIPNSLIAVNNDFLFDYAVGYTDEKGRYKIDCLGKGDVVAYIDASPYGYVRTRKPCKITDGDNNTVLDFRLNKGATISGRFVDENDNPVEINKSAFAKAGIKDAPQSQHRWTGVRHKHAPKAPEMRFKEPSPTFDSLKGDYTVNNITLTKRTAFVINGMKPGTVRFRFYLASRKQEVIKILHKGKDIKDTGLLTHAGENIEDIKVVIRTFPESSDMQAMPPHKGVVLETHKAFAWPSSSHLSLNLSLVNKTSVHTKNSATIFTLSKKDSHWAWERHFGTALESDRYPIVVLRYCAKNLTSSDKNNIWLDSEQGGINLIKHNEIISDGEIHEIRKDLRELNAGKTNIIGVDLSIESGEELPASYELISLRFEPAPGTQPIPLGESKPVKIALTANSGKPVQEAKVSIDYDWINLAKSDTTDAQGMVTITPFDIKSESRSLKIEKDGKAPFYFNLKGYESDKPIRLTLPGWEEK